MDVVILMSQHTLGNSMVKDLITLVKENKTVIFLFFEVKVARSCVTHIAVHSIHFYSEISVNC